MEKKKRIKIGVRVRWTSSFTEKTGVVTGYACTASGAPQYLVDGLGPKSPFLTIASSARKMTVNQNYIIFFI